MSSTTPLLSEEHCVSTLGRLLDLDCAIHLVFLEHGGQVLLLDDPASQSDALRRGWPDGLKFPFVKAYEIPLTRLLSGIGILTSRKD